MLLCAFGTAGMQTSHKSALDVRTSTIRNSLALVRVQKVGRRRSRSRSLEQLPIGRNRQMWERLKVHEQAYLKS